MRWIAVIVVLATSAVLAGGTATPAQISFALREGLMWTVVSVADSNTKLSFIIDTGASVSVIDSNAARRLNLSLGKRVWVSGVGGEGIGYWPTHMKSSIDRHQLPSKFLCLNLEELSESCGRRIDGLIGADFFRGKVVELNFRNGTLTFVESRQVDQGEQLPLKQTLGGFLVPVAVNGKAQQWFRLDTGCAADIHWVNRTGKRSGRPSTISVGLSQTRTTIQTVNLRIGTIEAANVPAIVHDRPIFPGEAGLLGVGFLANFRVIIDPAASHLYLHKSE